MLKKTDIIKFIKMQNFWIRFLKKLKLIGKN